MLSRELLKYTKIYHGEAMMPERYDGTFEAMIWRAEQVICEDMPYVIRDKYPIEDLINYVDSYIGKWAPYDREAAMEIYLKRF